MERLTHKRENGIKRGYWSPNKKQELVDRLAMYEHAAEKKSSEGGFHAVRDCQKMKATYWYHSKIPQCQISHDTKKMTRVVHSIQEMMKNHIQAMDFFVNAWMPLPKLYREV